MADRNIDVWRAHAATKQAAGEPFWSTAPRVPAPSLDVTRTRGASHGPPSGVYPFNDEAAFATKELIAQWTRRKEAGNAHFSAGEHTKAREVYGGIFKDAHFSAPHPDDIELIKLCVAVLGNLVESLLRTEEFEPALSCLSLALAYDCGHVKNRIRFVRASHGIPGRTMSNRMIFHCLYSLKEEEGRESERVKALIHECRRRLERVHESQLGLIRGAGASELMTPELLADGTRYKEKSRTVVQICDPHGNSGCHVLDARFALGVALEMVRPEPEIARRAEELRRAESRVEKALGAPGPLAWDSPAAYSMADVNRTQFYPGFLGSENCGPNVGDGSEVLM